MTASTTRLGMRLDAEQVFRGWAAAHTHAFWLDAGPGATTGRSWVGIGDPAAPDRVRDVTVGRADRVSDVPREQARRGPVVGSWVGWSGYDRAAADAGAPACQAVTGDERWLTVRAVVEFDHVRDEITVHAVDAEELAAHLSGLASFPPGEDADARSARVSASVRHRAEEYARLIAQCREEIRHGNAYQLCLTTRFEVIGQIDPVAAYLRLRGSVSAHHGGFIRSGDRTLLSASPEQFLEVQGDRVRTHPIKGTRPRDPHPVRDRALADELRADVKERAENVMIVDLMRNDLSRVCRVGTVTVERLFEVESYPAVHQLVSTVAGDLSPGLRLADLLAAAFPAGSMTGAPKLSAMSILHRLEGGPRGVFAGCFGWVGASGDLDLAMVIRSIVIDPDGAYVGAGGGITWLSRPDAEVAEVAIKARGPLAAVGADLPEDWADARPGG